MPKPRALVHLETTIRWIRGMCLDSVKNYLFVLGFEGGDFIVFDINRPGHEQLTKEVARFKNKPNVFYFTYQKSRQICWSSKRGEMYIGNLDGTITIWDTKKGSPIRIILLI